MDPEPVEQLAAVEARRSTRAFWVAAWLIGGTAAIVGVPPLRAVYLDVWNASAFAPIALAAGTAVVALCLDLVALGWARSAARALLFPGASARHDIANAVLKVSGLTWIPLSIATFGAFPLGVAIVAWIFRLGTAGPLAGLTAVQSLIAALVIGDFFYYWYHRFMHRLRFAWQLHVYHHAATEFTILTGRRVHLGEVIFNGIMVSVPLAILGVRIETFFWFAVVRLVISWLHHSMADWTFGWVGTWFVFSPVGHRIHHSEAEEHWDKNFGNMFTWWDHLFKTYYRGDNVNSTVGVTENPLVGVGVVEGFTGCLWRAFSVAADSASNNRWLMPDRPQP